MPATSQQVSVWFDDGKRFGADHMIIAVNAEGQDYPVYLSPPEDAKQVVAAKFSGQNGQSTRHVFDLKQNKKQQIERSPFPVAAPLTMVSIKPGQPEIIYVQGDATKPLGIGNKIVAHICNDRNLWGAGFVLAVAERWPAAKNEYHSKFHTERPRPALGDVIFVPIEDGLWVADMIAQHGVRMDEKGNPPIRYTAVGKCLWSVARWAQKYDCVVHMPRIGCGLAGGTWREIEPIIRQELTSQNVTTVVYDL